MSEEIPLAKRFREQLRRHREAQDLEQRVLADRVGRSQQWLAKIEAGNQSVKLEDAELLAEALGLDVVYLLVSEHEFEMSRKNVRATLKRHKTLLKEATEGIAAEKAKRRELAEELDESATRQFRYENQLARSQQMIESAERHLDLGRVREGK
jgi:transcriptional regulator with XRE-family HTH domain